MANYHNIAGSSELRKLVRSKYAVATITAATHTMIEIPKWAFVTDVWLYIPTACTAVEVSVGWKGNGETAQTAGFISAGSVDISKVGLYRASHDTLVAFAGKWFSSASGAITFTNAASITTGRVLVLADYAIMH